MDNEGRVSVLLLMGSDETNKLWSNPEEVAKTISREAAVFEEFDSIGFNLDESHEYDVEFIESRDLLVERIEQLVTQSRRSSVIVLSEQLVSTTATGRTAEASELAQRVRAAFLADRAVEHGHLCGLVGLVRGERQRIKDIDSVVDIRSASLSELRAAVNRTADGLWMKAPRRRFSLADEDAIKVQVVNSRSQLEDCLRLRHDVYGLMGYLDDSVWKAPSRLEMDPFDLASIHLAATDKITGDVVGTLRLVFQNVRQGSPDSIIGRAPEVLARHQEWCRQIARSVTEDVFRRSLGRALVMPLPVLENSDFGERWPEFLDGNRTKFGGEVSRVLVAPRYQGLGVSRLLMRAAIAVAFDLGKSFLLLECIPAHVKMYEKYGFEPLKGHHCRAQGLDQIAVGMRLDLDDTPFNAAVSLSKRHIQILRKGPAAPAGLAGLKVLCLCSNRHCWQDGSYSSMGTMLCPLRDLHAAEVSGFHS